MTAGSVLAAEYANAEHNSIDSDCSSVRCGVRRQRNVVRIKDRVG
jgi:hypothetical protein